MTLTRRAAIAATLALPTIARSQPAAVKIGLITTLSGPGGYPGAYSRDGFMLAVENGRLAGIAVNVLVEDDALKPAQAKQIANRFLKSEGITIFTGIVFSNVMEAVAPDVLESGAIYVSSNAGPSSLAGKGCHPNYYVVSFQNDAFAEAAGALATSVGYKRMYLLAPNYPAGKDSLAGFNRFFKGEVIGESYTRLDQTDYAPEMAQIRAANPDAVYQFHPGGLGIAFIRQYQQAGLTDKIPMAVSWPSLDATTLTAVGEAGLGIDVAAHWNSDLDNPANEAFVAAFIARHNRMPTVYAAEGYDTALAIGAALQRAGGNAKDPARFRQAMLAAKFQSVRGKFRFGQNQHPVQDWYAVRSEKTADGKLALVTKGRVLSDYGDFYAAQCKI